ncbi:MAG: methylated-DNA--[protein]-cysteine S-methyltransferase [Spirochaetales bacterium]|nr:methylated-DNA--[protein]-cysteine S-methyltransferase [Spirochaetales bacterium]
MKDKPFDAYFTFIETPVGNLMITADRAGALYSIVFSSAPVYLPRLTYHRAAGECDEAIKELEEYFNGTRTSFTVRCRYDGATVFETDVWRACAAIPYNTTKSYSDIAVTAGKPGADRAAGNAVGKNRIPIIIPCHRVIRKSGSLGGFGPGPEKKRALLELERHYGRVKAQGKPD